jgi:frataxin-like iron-binding protein CyaY
MKVPTPPQTYTPVAEAQRNLLLENADRQNRKINADVEIASSKLILTSPNGSRYSVVVSNAGALSATAL